MVKPVLKQLFLRDADGGVTPFDADALQTRLIGAFLAAGRQEDSFLSEEIVLALEYTLLRSPRPEPVFSCGETDAAVIRLLESVGYPEVARIFRKGGSENTLLLSCTPEQLTRVFSSHLGCSQERLEKIVTEVADSLQKLRIAEASPHLLLELARHYERVFAENDLLPEGCAIPLPVPDTKTLTRQEIYALLPPAPKLLVEQGVLRINGVTTLFPGIRFFFFIGRFAEIKGWHSPLTELEAEPPLYQAGSALEAARLAITAQIGGANELPCCLAIPDMFDYLNGAAGTTAPESLATELAGVLTSALGTELYKLALD